MVEVVGWNPPYEGCMNHLYYGDNLRVLRESIGDDSIDRIYLDRSSLPKLRQLLCHNLHPLPIGNSNRESPN